MTLADDFEPVLNLKENINCGEEKTKIIVFLHILICFFLASNVILQQTCFKYNKKTPGSIFEKHFQHFILLK